VTRALIWALAIIAVSLPLAVVKYVRRDRHNHDGEWDGSSKSVRSAREAISSLANTFRK
jgi:hypothetical protein